MPVLENTSAIAVDSLQNSTIPSTEDIVQSVGSMSDILNSYGVVIGMLSVFLIIFILLVIVLIVNNRALMKRLMNETNNKNTKSTQESAKEIADVCFGKIQDLMSNISKETEEAAKKEEEKHKGLVGISIAANAVFKEASKTVIEETKCDRLGLYVFHNGNVSLYGYPFAKTSCIFELTDEGRISTSRGKTHKDIPLYAISELIDFMMQSEDFYMDIGKSSEEFEEQLLELVAGLKTKSIFFKTVKDKWNRMIAFIMLEYDSNRSDMLSSISESATTMVKTIFPIVINEAFNDIIECKDDKALESGKGED